MGYCLKAEADYERCLNELYRLNIIRPPLSLQSPEEESVEDIPRPHLHSMEDIASTPAADMRFYDPHDQLVSGGKKKRKRPTKKRRPTKRRRHTKKIKHIKKIKHTKRRR